MSTLMSRELPAHDIPITSEFQMGIDWGVSSYSPDLEREAHQVDVENP